MVRRPRPFQEEDRSIGSAGTTTRALVGLDEPGAFAVGRVGAKAAALARARRAGLPVVPGAVVPVTAALDDVAAALESVWPALSGGRRLAVRSSSPHEDGAERSMAGHFTTVLDVESAEAAVAAVQEVRDSADGQPMAVLLQPMVDAAVGGVLFGLDPVGGRTDHLLVEAVAGSPAGLVGGEVTASRLVLRRGGRVAEADPGAARLLGRAERRTLAAAARAAAEVFGGPQDVEWAFDTDGRFWLLQARPVTAAAVPPTATGPVFGPGPVAETLPGVLTPLETELWVPPLRSGIREALGVVGVVPRRRLAGADLVVTIGGRVAADLDLLGVRGRPGLLRRFDPRPPARRLAAAWRVGRLQQAIPALAADVVARVDADLAAVPALSALDDRALLDLLAATQRSLHAVHGHEVLTGMLGADEGGSAAVAALVALTAGRHDGLADAAIIARDPVVLSLVPPRVGGTVALPPTPARPLPPAPPGLSPREALRLRARWLQELGAVAAGVLGDRLHARRLLSAPGLVRWLSIEELGAAVTTGTVPADVAARATAEGAPPLPTRFRLGAGGTVVAVATTAPIGRAASPGRAAGPVHHGSDGPPPTGSVLVVGDLEPGLAAWLPSVAAVVAESGSTLSHLAIVARELGVPTVVGVADARRRFPAGTEVLVDGTTGEVATVEGSGR